LVQNNAFFVPYFTFQRYDLFLTWRAIGKSGHLFGIEILNILSWGYWGYWGNGRFWDRVPFVQV